MKHISEFEIRARQELYQVLADMSSPEEINDFLTTFISESEVQNLAKKLAIMRMLEQNASYDQIQKELTVSSATVSAMVQTKNHPISQRVLERIEAHSWAEEMAQRIINYFNPDKPQQSRQF